MGAGSSQDMSVVEIPATARHSATLIFLHGLGDTGHGWAEHFRALKLKHVKCICPTASMQSVTLNGGLKMTSWFDIRGLSPDSPEDEEGIKEASQKLKDLVDKEESEGIPSNKVVIGGFSQGGAVALYTAFTMSKPLAGVIALSSWMPLNKQFPAVVKGNQTTPVLQCHGTADHVVPFEWGSLTAKLVSSFNSNHELKTYPGVMHSSCPQEMIDVKEFLSRHLDTE